MKHETHKTTEEIRTAKAITERTKGNNCNKTAELPYCYKAIAAKDNALKGNDVIFQVSKENDPISQVSKNKEAN